MQNTADACALANKLLTTKEDSELLVIAAFSEVRRPSLAVRGEPVYADEPSYVLLDVVPNWDSTFMFFGVCLDLINVGELLDETVAQQGADSSNSR